MLPAGPGQLPDVENYLDAAYIDSEDFRPHDIDDANQISAAPREIRVWPDLAAASVTCKSSGANFSALNFSISLYWVDEEDLSDALAEIMVPFVDEQVEKIGTLFCVPPE